MWERKTVEKIPGRLFWNFLCETRLSTSLCVRFSAHKHEDAWKVSFFDESHFYKWAQQQDTCFNMRTGNKLGWWCESQDSLHADLYSGVRSDGLRTSDVENKWRDSPLYESVRAFLWIGESNCDTPLTEVCRMKVCRQQSEAPSMLKRKCFS